MKVVHIYKDDTMDELIIDSVHDLVKHSKSQGEGTFQSLYNWKYSDSVIHCYGWYDGEAGFENKHDLPPGGTSGFLTEDSSSQLLFGDIFILKYTDNDSQDLQDFDISEYGEFYNLSFGGFSDISDESEEDPTDEDMDDFIVDDETHEGYGPYNDDGDDGDDEDDEDEGDDELKEYLKDNHGELEEDTYQY